MVQKIGNSVQCNGSLAASGCPLDHHDLILGISDNGILLLLDGADNVLKSYASAAAQLCHQNLVIYFHITLKLVDHFSITDLVLPFGCNLTGDSSKRCFIGSRSLIIIIEKAAHRSSPVVDQRRMSGFLCKIADADIKDLRLILSFKYKIHSSEKRGIQHFTESFSQMDLLLIGIDLMEQCLLVIKILISVLVHLCIVFPVVFMHSLDVLLAFQNGFADVRNTCFQFVCDKSQKCFSVSVVNCHIIYSPSSFHGWYIHGSALHILRKLCSIIHYLPPKV